MKPEFVAALEAIKRRQAVTEVREKIRESAGKDIHIF
jgi:hypothetical protein